MPGRPIFVVDNDRALDRFIDEWLPSIDGNQIALDIEEDRARFFRPQVALIQITMDNEDAIVDPLSFDVDDLAAVVEAICLTPSSIIMHGARNDVVGLKRDFGVGPHRLLDTQIAARFLGRTRFGLAALLDDEFGRTLNKEARRSDWTQRPLTPKQLAYARADTAWLHGLWDRLNDLLDDSDWGDAFDEECDALSELPAEELIFDPLGWRKIKGISRLDPVAATRAHIVWQWREDESDRANVHPSRLAPPWCILQIATNGVSAIRPGSRTGRAVSTAGDGAVERLRELLESDAAKRAWEAPRKTRKSSRRPVSADVWRSRVEGLMQWRTTECRRTELEAGWLAPRGVLEAAAAVASPTESEFAAADGVRRWRARRYTGDWSKIIRRV